MRAICDYVAISEICDWRYSNVPGTNWKNCSSKTWEIWHFSSFVPIFLPAPTKYTVFCSNYAKGFAKTLEQYGYHRNKAKGIQFTLRFPIVP